MAGPIDQFRAQYPGAYDDVPDEQLAERIRKTYYAKEDPAAFWQFVGLRPPQGTLQRYVTDPAVRGAARAGQGLAALGADTGLISPETAAGVIGGAEEMIQARRPSVSTQRALQDISSAPDFMTAAGTALRNPGAIAETAVESAAQSAPGILAGVAGGAAAGVPGAIAGFGLGAGAVEYMASVQDAWREAGVDPANPQQLAAALQNPEAVAKAREYARARAVPIAAFSALSGGLAGRLVAGARGPVSAVGRGTAELGLQAGLEGAGEATAQLASKGQIQPGDVLLESAAGIPGGVPEIAMGAYNARRRPEQPVAAPVSAPAPRAAETLPDQMAPFGEPPMAPYGTPFYEPKPFEPNPDSVPPETEWQPSPFTEDYDFVPGPLSDPMQAIVGDVAAPKQSILPVPTDGPLGEALARNQQQVAEARLGQMAQPDFMGQRRPLDPMAKAMSGPVGFPPVPQTQPAKPARTDFVRRVEPQQQSTALTPDLRANITAALQSQPFSPEQRAPLVQALRALNRGDVVQHNNRQVEILALPPPDAKSGVVKAREIATGKALSWPSLPVFMRGVRAESLTEQRGPLTEQADVPTEQSVAANETPVRETQAPLRVTGETQATTPSMTKERFLAEYRRKLEEEPDFEGRDSAVKSVIDSARATISSAKTNWVYDAPKARAAWAAMGGKRKDFSLRALRNLDPPFDDGSAPRRTSTAAQPVDVDSAVRTAVSEHSGANRYKKDRQGNFAVSRKAVSEIERAVKSGASPKDIYNKLYDAFIADKRPPVVAENLSAVLTMQFLGEDELDALAARQTAPTKPAGKSTTPISQPRPQSLADFLASTGGINIADRRETAMEGSQWLIPKAGPLWRKAAKSLDYARERAVEAGYLRSDATVEDLVRALNKDRAAWKAKDLTGRVYAGGESVVDTREADRDAERVAEVEAYSRENGYELTPREMRSIAETMATEGMDVSDAVDRFIENDMASVDAEMVDAGEPEGDTPPLGDERPQAERAGATGASGTGGQERAPATVTEEPGAEGLPQLVLPGMERSAKQAKAARYAAGPRKGQKPADEGLFAPKEKEQGEIQYAVAPSFEAPGSPEYRAAVAKGLDMSREARMKRAREMGFDVDTLIYHGSDATKIDAFDDAFIGTANDPGHYGRGHYFASSPGEAGYYGKNVNAYVTKAKLLDLTSNTDDSSDYGQFLDWTSKLDKIGALDAGYRPVLESLKKARAYLRDNVQYNKGVNQDGSEGWFAAVNHPEFPDSPDERIEIRLKRGEFPKTKKEALEDLEFRFMQEMTSYSKDTFPGLDRADRTLSDYVRVGSEGGARGLTEAAQKAGYGGILYGDETVVFDPRDIRSINAAFDPDNADSPNLLAAVAPTPTARFARDRSAIVAEATKLAKQINPEVTVEAVDSIFDVDPKAFERSGGTAGMEPVGAFYPAQSLIRVALGQDDRSIIGVVGHESFHAVSPLLTNAQRAVLERGVPVSGNRTREEDFAYSFQAFLESAESVPLLVRPVFFKLRQFIEGLRSLLRGRGFNNPVDVFEQIRRGDVARKAGLSGPAQEQNRQRPSGATVFGAKLAEGPSGRAQSDGLFNGPLRKNPLTPPNSGSFQASDERTWRDAVTLAKLFPGKAGVLKGGDLVNAPALRVVQGAMGRIAENDEVLDSIVSLVPVDVMNVLVGPQRTANGLPDHKAMLKNQLSGMSTGLIPVSGPNGPAEPVRLVARAVAEVALGSQDLGRRGTVGSGAKLAGQFDRQSGLSELRRMVSIPWSDWKAQADQASVQYAVAPAPIRPDWIAHSDPDGAYDRIRGATVGGLYQRSKDWWMSEGLTQLVDRFQPVLQAGRRVMKHDPGYMHRLVEMAANDGGAVQAVMEAGAPQLNKDTLAMELAPGSEGLAPIMTRHLLGKPNSEERQNDAYKAGAYRYAQRAKRLMAEGRERLLSDADIAKALDVTKAERERYDAMWADYDKHNRAVLKFAEDAGVIAQGTAEQWSAYGDYVPFYRVMEDEGELVGPKEYYSGLSNPDPKIKKLKGGTSKLGDPYTNIARNERALISAARRNVALQAVAKVLTKADEARIVPMTGDSKSSILLFENGQKKRLQIDDPAVAASLVALGPQQTNGIMKFLQTFAQIYRAGVTLTPSFAIANMLRDIPSSYIQTGASISARHNAITEMARLYKGTSSINDVKAMTGFGGTQYSSEGSLFQPSLAEVVGTKRTGAFKTAARRVHDRLEALSQATEWANRLAIYDNLVAKGVPKERAAYEAMNVINYGRRGASPAIQALVQLVPFLNARIQGLSRMFETQGAGFGSVERKKLLQQLMLRGLILSAASAAIFAGYDDEDWAKYDEEALEKRAGYHIIYTGDTPILIPKAFEWGTIFSTMPETLIRAINGKHEGELAKVITHTLVNTFAFNPIPQAILPALEAVVNFDLFRMRDLEPQYLQRFMPQERVFPTTSPTAAAIARALPGDISPIKVQHLVEGYGGAAANAMLFAIDGALGSMGAVPEAPSGVFGDGIAAKLLQPILGRFVRDGEVAPAEISIQKLYDIKRKAEQAYATANELMRRGEVERAREIMTENARPIALRKQLDRTTDMLADLTKQARQVRMSPTMSADEKRTRINELTARKNALARQQVAALNRAA